MLLARMVTMDENALICDLAETYQIFSWRELPARFVATLAAGLKPSARIKLILSGAPAPVEQLLLASIADSCRLLVWLSSAAAQKGKAPPASLFDLLFNKAAKKTSSTGFSSGAEFDNWRKNMLKGGEKDASTNRQS